MQGEMEIAQSVRHELVDAVSVSGGTDAGGNKLPGLSGLNNNRVSIGVGNSFSEIDNVTWIKGRHTLKAGAEVRRIQLNQGNTEAGTISGRSGLVMSTTLKPVESVTNR